MIPVECRLRRLRRSQTIRVLSSHRYGGESGWFREDGEFFLCCTELRLAFVYNATNPNLMDNVGVDEVGVDEVHFCACVQQTFGRGKRSGVYAKTDAEFLNRFSAKRNLC